MINTRGFFITLEGIEGVGKSTFAKYIQSYLQNLGYEVCVTREPGGTPIAETLRGILLTHNEETINQHTEMLLLFAGRSQHITQVIEPALAKGQWVICDRFTDATYAYQGYGRGVPLAEISALEQLVQGKLKPDLVLIFDAPVALALGRTKRRGKPDRMEAETTEFFQRVRNGYLARAKENPEQYKIIDASSPLHIVREQVKNMIDGAIQQWKK